MDQPKSEEEILKILSTAFPEEKYRKDMPQIHITYPEQDFYQFKVNDQGQDVILKTYRFQPECPPKAMVLIFHGLGSHQMGAAHIAADFAKLGCVCVGYDYKGHGQSEGKRGLIESWNAHMAVAQQFLEEMVNLYLVKNNLKDLPVFAAGLSLGGLTTYSIGVRNQNVIKGIIMYAPALKFIDTCVIASEEKVEFNPKTISKNPFLQDLIQIDPLAQIEFPKQTMASVMEGMSEAQASFKDLKLSWILIQGEIDFLVHPLGAVECHQVSPSGDKTLLYYSNLWHEVWHEEEIWEIQEKVCKWLGERI